MTRRDLIQKIVLGGTTLIVMPSVLESCTKTDNQPGTNNSGSDNFTIDLTNPSFSALNTAGVSIVYKGVIVANTGNNVFVALDSVCTHLGCTVNYNSANNNFPCPCHGSLFSTNGSVLNGPAGTPLKKYTISRSENILTISP